MSTIWTTVCDMGRWAWQNFLQPLLLDVFQETVRITVSRVLQVAADAFTDWVASLARWSNDQVVAGGDEESLASGVLQHVLDALAGVAASMQAKAGEFRKAEDVVSALTVEFEAATRLIHSES